MKRQRRLFSPDYAQRQGSMLLVLQAEAVQVQISNASALDAVAIMVVLSTQFSL
jgi:hypothetical protein